PSHRGHHQAELEVQNHALEVIEQIGQLTAVTALQPQLDPAVEYLVELIDVQVELIVLDTPPQPDGQGLPVVDAVDRGYPGHQRDITGHAVARIVEVGLRLVVVIDIGPVQLPGNAIGRFRLHYGGPGQGAGLLQGADTGPGKDRLADGFGTAQGGRRGGVLIQGCEGTLDYGLVEQSARLGRVEQ